MNALVVSNLGLVNSVVSRLWAEGVRSEREDMIAFGRQGLVEAASRYKPTLGNFSGYAHQRIRGAIVDGLRKMGPWSRRGYERVSATQALDTDSRTDARIQRHLAQVISCEIFAKAAFDGEEIVAVDQSVSQEQQLEYFRLAASVRDAIEHLSEPDRTVIQRMYVEGDRLEDIGSDLGCSKSWASRINTRALRALNRRLTRPGIAKCAPPPALVPKQQPTSALRLVHSSAIPIGVLAAVVELISRGETDEAAEAALGVSRSSVAAVRAARGAFRGIRLLRTGVDCP